MKFSLFLKYILLPLTVGLNLLFFLVIDIPVAIFNFPRKSFYLMFFYNIYFSVVAQIGYWLARYLVVEAWIHDDNNSVDFAAHYYQWRFFLIVRRYLLKVFAIIFKILLDWVLSIIHFFYWSFLQFLINWRRNYKKFIYNLEFIIWKITYAFGVRLNLSFNYKFRFCAFKKDFLYFDRKGWYYYGRDFINLETLNEKAIPNKFRIKKEITQVELKQRLGFRKFLFNLNKIRTDNFQKNSLLSFVKSFEKEDKNIFENYQLDLFNNIILRFEQKNMEQPVDLNSSNNVKILYKKEFKQNTNNLLVLFKQRNQEYIKKGIHVEAEDNVNSTTSNLIKKNNYN
jgi:hypothetical protein